MLSYCNRYSLRISISQPANNIRHKKIIAQQHFKWHRLRQHILNAWFTWLNLTKGQLVSFIAKIFYQGNRNRNFRPRNYNHNLNNSISRQIKKKFKILVNLGSETRKMQCSSCHWRGTKKTLSLRRDSNPWLLHNIFLDSISCSLFVFQENKLY